MGFKLPWFRARMRIKHEEQVKNAQLVGTYSYKFDSVFDSNANSKLTAVDTRDEKQDTINNLELKDKKLPAIKKNKSAEKSKTESNPENKPLEKESSIEEQKTNTVLIEKNITNVNKTPEKPERIIDNNPEQLFESTTEEKVQQTSSKDVNNEYRCNIETDLTNHTSIPPNIQSESNVSNETDTENQKNSKTDTESSIPLRNNSNPQVSNEGQQNKLLERRLPNSDLGMLTIIIPDNSDEFEEIFDEEFDEEDFVSSSFDDCNAYDEFDN